MPPKRLTTRWEVGDAVSHLAARPELGEITCFLQGAAAKPRGLPVVLDGWSAHSLPDLPAFFSSLSSFRNSPPPRAPRKLVTSASGLDLALLLPQGLVRLPWWRSLSLLFPSLASDPNWVDFFRLLGKGPKFHVESVRFGPSPQVVALARKFSCPRPRYNFWSLVKSGWVRKFVLKLRDLGWLVRLEDRGPAFVLVPLSFEVESFSTFVSSGVFLPFPLPPSPSDISFRKSPGFRKVPRFFALPKCHKSPVVARPIVSFFGCSSSAEKSLSSLLSSFLSSRPSCSVSSRDELVAKMRDFGPFESLVSGDISSLFSSVSLVCLRRALVSYLPSAVELFDRVRSSWFVHYDGTFALLPGLPMGSSVSPPLANFYLWSLEVSNSPLISTFRYVDDLVRMSRLGSGISEEDLRRTYDDQVSPLQVVWKEVPDCLDLWLRKDPFTDCVATGFKNKEFASPPSLRGLPLAMSSSVARAEFLRRASASLGPEDVSEMFEMFEIDPSEPLPPDLFDEVFKPMFLNVISEFKPYAAEVSKLRGDPLALLSSSFLPSSSPSPPSSPLPCLLLKISWNPFWDLRPGRRLMSRIKAFALSSGIRVSIRWKFSSRKLGSVLCWKCPWVYLRVVP